MFSSATNLAKGYFKLVLPDRMSCDVPFQGPIKYPLYKDSEFYEHCLNAAFLTASISEDRFCFMLEPGKNKTTLELVVPALPSSTIGLKSPRTRRLLLFFAISLYSKNQLTYANKRYAKEIKLMDDYMFANEHSAALNFETQREVDTILASNISVTEFLEALIAEPRIRHLWVLVQGKSGSSYRLRICDTELALCKDGDGDTALHVWPWQEVGEPKYRKTEVRMPWLITDERPQLTPVLADVLQSTRPENLNEAKRRKLSRADSIPPPTVFDAKYHFTITVFVKDINVSSKLVYQITCIRAMAFANGTQPIPDSVDNSLHRSNSIATNHLPKGKMQKKKGFSLCGLNCMGRKEREEMDENLGSHPPQKCVEYTQSGPSSAGVATPQNLQVDGPPSPPQRRRSSSIAKQTMTDEGDIESASFSTQSPTDENLVTKIPNAMVCSEPHESMLNPTPSSSKISTSVNLSRYPTYTKSDAMGQFLNESQITSTYKSQPAQAELEAKSTPSSPKTHPPKPSYESKPIEVPQLSLSVTAQTKDTASPGLPSSMGAENVSDCSGRSQPSPAPSPKKREMGVSPSSPTRTSTSPHSGIPLPRNPTRAMVGATHRTPSPSGELVEMETSDCLNEATLEARAAAISSTTALEGSVNPDKNKSGPTGIISPILHGTNITATVSGIDIVWESKLSLRPSEVSVFTDPDTKPKMVTSSRRQIFRSMMPSFMEQNPLFASLLPSLPAYECFSSTMELISKMLADSEENAEAGLTNHSSSLTVQETPRARSQSSVDTDAIANKQIAIMSARHCEVVSAVCDEDNCSILTHSPMLELSDSTSESHASLLVQAIPVIAPTATSDPVTQNGTTKTDVSSPTPPLTQLAQTRRPSGLIGPKVVVNKPGISVYKGRNAPSLSSSVKTGPGGDSPNGSPTMTVTPQAAPTVATAAAAVAVVSAKSSNIRPPMVTTEAKVTRYHLRTSIPTRSNPAIRNGHDSPSAVPSQATATRSTSTGIRMPSQLSRQTLAK